MVRPDWWSLSSSEQEAYHAAFRFLGDRLEELETMVWALNLGPKDHAKRLAIRELLGSGRRKAISDPWREAWHLIIENWRRPLIERNSHTEIYDIRERLNTGEYTNGVVSAIVDLVTPRLKIRLLDGGRIKRRKSPKTKDDLISCSLTSGRIIDIEVLKLGTIDKKDFLFLLATSLDELLVSNLDLARRIGWDGEHFYWVIGQMNRVYYAYEKNENGRKEEPDEFADGIVPAVKLLYEVLARLADVDLGSAVSFVTRWKPTDSQIHLRLLAALYRDKRMATRGMLDAFFAQLNDRQFWDLRIYPEIAELRAKRFNDLSSKTQLEILRKIKKGPPRSHWPRSVDKERVKEARQYNAVREMKRVRLAGGEIPEDYTEWLEDELSSFPELIGMEEVEGGFPEGVKVRSVGPKPDLQFDTLEGEERLRALEAGLAQKRSWFDDEGNAGDWIRSAGNSQKLISDLESATNRGAQYPVVWEKLGWAHSPNIAGDDAENRNLVSESARFLKLLENLEDRTIAKAINGISHWLSSWRKQLLENPKGVKVWLKVWPLAVSATNNEKVEDELDLSTTGRVEGNDEPKDLDTLNTPAGKLITVFLDGCSNIEDGVKPFAKGQPLRKMRDTIFSSSQRSLLVAQHRFVEFLSYFINADQRWAENNLIKPLKSEEPQSVILWRSISRRIQRQKVLEIIGDEVVMRTRDLRLSRDSRSMLVRNLVIESLHAYWLKRAPAVDYFKVQQALRSVEDEVRISGAEILPRFVRDSSNPKHVDEKPVPNPEDLFFRAVKPFLTKVWPQERSLSTPGVSKALADLPAATGEAFTDAVDMVERFLVPFDCWTLGDFGFYGAVDDELKLVKIDNHEKADAFLRLLDRSIGTNENSVAPHELANALDHINKINPKLSKKRSFRRLEAVTRR